MDDAHGRRVPSPRALDRAANAEPLRRRRGRGQRPRRPHDARIERVLRVLKVLAKLEPGGAQLSILRIARAFAARGHETRLLVGFASEAGIALARAHGVEPELMGSPHDLQWTCDEDFAAWLEPRLEDADVVHAHMLGAWWAAGQVVGHDVPFVASEHNDLLWPDAPLTDRLPDVVDRIDRFYAHSPGARAAVLAAGLREDRMVLGTSPVVGMDAVERPGLPPGRIVFTGRLMPDKGPDVLVEAIARMVDPPPVLILGAGRLEAQLRDAVAAAGLEDVVRLQGWIPDPAPWVAGAALQVCPSRDEAFSQSAVLAMGLGVPVIGTRVDGFPATLADGRGVMVDPDDPAGLAAAIEGVLDHTLRTDLDGARSWAARYEVEEVASAYERDYRELADGVMV